MPSQPPAAADLEARRLFLCHLEEIRDQLDRVARQARLSPQQAEEFVAWAFLRMVEDGFKVVAQWRGESSLRSFLGVVVTRLLLDFRNERWGRWRVSKTAKKAGLASQFLDVLIHRDGLAVAEAVEMVLRNHPRAVRAQLDAEDGAGPGGQERSEEDRRARLLELADELPARQSRRMASLEDLPLEVLTPEDRDADWAADGSGEDAPDLRVRRGDRRRLARKVEEILDRHCRDLGDDDRRMIRMWFRDRAEAAEIAEVLGLPRRRVYHRITTVLGQLRRRFRAEGLDPDEVLELVGRAEGGEIEVGLLRPAA